MARTHDKVFTGVMILVSALSIAATVSPLYTYHRGSDWKTVTLWNYKSCTGGNTDAFCTVTPIQIFAPCEEYKDRFRSMAGFCVMAIITSLLASSFVTMDVVGRAPHRVGIFFSATAFLFTLLSWASIAGTFATSQLCSNPQTFKKQDFDLSVAFGLFIVANILMLLFFPYYILARRQAHNKYHEEVQ